MIRRAFLKAFGTAILGLTLTKTLPGIGGDEAPAVPEPPSQELRVGDVITFEGRNAINPVTREVTEHPQRFIVTAVSGSTFTIYPSVYGQPDASWGTLQ
jgi:hypothetical protein